MLTTSRCRVCDGLLTQILNMPDERVGTFFSRQRELRSELMLCFFGAASSILILALAAGWITAIIGWAYGSRVVTLTPELILWQDRLPYLGGGAVVLVVLVATGWHYWRLLRLNPSALGAREVHKRLSATPERVVINVVEELAIASAQPIPRLFIVTNDLTINSFSLQLPNEQTNLFITQGAMDLLSRDELQALCAYEYAHLESGDSHRNVTLLAIIQGIRLIHVAVSSLLGLLFSLGRIHPAALVPWFVAGLLLLPMWLVGKFGVYIAHWLQRLFARKRVWLADAGVLEFTRDPQALIDLLNKADASLTSAEADEVQAATAFMRFASCGSAKPQFWRLHPSIQSRINALGGEFR